MTQSDRADVFRGLAHPLRRKVLRMLQNQECTVTELLAAFRCSMPTLSRHLGILRETGLVSQKLVGIHRYYQLRRGSIRQIQQWLQPFDG
jgi:DNA-binding transcriptional ArsR family regulator